MVDSRALSSPLIWESSDIEESFEKRKYSYIRDILCILDESVYDKTITYKKEDTKLGYDVYLRYDKIDDYIKISFLTSYMIPNNKIICDYEKTDSTCADFQEMVRYFYNNITENTQYNEFQSELIRERSGRILDNFFLYLLPEKHHKDFKIENPYNFDPLDGIVDFSENPDYLNGGFYYLSPVKNDFIYNIQDKESIKQKSFELYDGNLIGYENEKVKNMIKNISEKLLIDVDDHDGNIYNGIKSFTNTFFISKKNTWFDYKNFKFRKSLNEKQWSDENSRFEYSTVIQYENKLSKDIFDINFGYNQYDGNLFDNPTVEQIKNIIHIYDSINDDYLKNFIFTEFISDYLTDKNILASNEIGKFIDIVTEYKFPEEYIDAINNILNDPSEESDQKLLLYVSFAIIPYKEPCYMYSLILFDLISYFLNAILNGNISYYDLNILKNPFSNIDNFATDDDFIKQISNHFFPVDCAIRILFMYKTVHEKDSENILLSQILQLSESFKIDSSVDNNKISFYKKQEILMLSVLISKLTHSSINNNVVPNYIDNICKLYIPDYREFKTDSVYDGKSHTIPASKYDINLIITLNMLANKIIKNPENQSIFIKVIQIVNILVGGKTAWVRKTYAESMKTITFFMLNTDRLNQHLLERYETLINKLSVPYTTECDIPFNDTIKHIIISQMMPLLWQQKLTDNHFDDLELIAQPFSEGHYDTNSYEIVRNKLKLYFGNLPDYQPIDDGEVHIEVDHQFRLCAWGKNNYGQIAKPLNIQKCLEISHISDYYKWSNIGCNSNGTNIAVKEDGTLWGWGNNSHNQIGIDGDEIINTITQIGIDNDWKNSIITGGDTYIIILKNDGTLWGCGSAIGLGIDEEQDYIISSFTKLNEFIWKDVSAMNETSIGIKDDGTLWIWGKTYSTNSDNPHNINLYYGLSDDINEVLPDVYNKIPIRLGKESTFKKVKCGNTSYAVIDEENKVWSWGLNSKKFGNLGYMGYAQKSSTTCFIYNYPNKILKSIDIQADQLAIYYNNDNSVYLHENIDLIEILDTEGHLFWIFRNKLLPHDIEKMGHVPLKLLKINSNKKEVIYMSDEQSNFIRSNAYNGEVGDGNDDHIHYRMSLYEIGMRIDDWDNMVCGRGYVIGLIKSDQRKNEIPPPDKNVGKLWGWGMEYIQTDNQSLSLFLNGLYDGYVNNDPVLEPVRFNDDQNWELVRCTGWFVYAIKEDGTLWGWGNNSTQPFATINNQPLSNPDAKPGDEDWKTMWNMVLIDGTTDWRGAQISYPLGAGHSIWAIKKDGSLWTWYRDSLMDGYPPIIYGAKNSNYKIRRYGYSNDWHKLFTLPEGAGYLLILQRKNGDFYQLGDDHWHFEKIVSVLYPYSYKVDSRMSLAYFNPLEKISHLDGYDCEKMIQYSFRDSTLSYYGTIILLTNGKIIVKGRESRKKFTEIGATYNGILGMGIGFNGEVPYDITSRGNGGPHYERQMGEDRWKSIRIGYNGRSVWGIKSDGTMWAWGYGLVGVFDKYPFDWEHRNWWCVPTQFGTDTDWKEFQGPDVNQYSNEGQQTYYAIKEDGTLWGWGTQVGDGGEWNKFHKIPVRIGNFTNFSIQYSEKTYIGIEYNG